MDSITIYSSTAYYPPGRRGREGRRIRISDLSRATGVSIPTIKYYLREGLIPPGTTTAPNQAVYAEVHVHRVRLVRALREVGGLGVDAIRPVMAALDDPGLSLHQILGVAHRAIAPAPAAAPLPELGEVDDLLRRLGWRVATDAPDRSQLARALAALRALGRDVDVTTFLPHAQAADELAAMEVRSLAAGTSPAETVEQAVVGTVVYGAALVALRRLAQEHHSSRRGSSRRSGA